MKIKAKRSNTKPTFDMKCFCFLLSTGRNVRFSITELTWICLKQKFLSFLWDPSHPSSQSPSPPPASRLPALHLWPQPDQTHRSDWKETSWRRCGWNVDADRPQSLLGSQHQIRVELETQICKIFQVFSNELCFSEAPPAVRVANCSLSCSLKQCRQLSPQHDGPGNTWDPHDYSPPTSEDWFFRGVRGWREVTPVRPSDAPCGSWSKTTPSITRTAWEILLEQRPDVLVEKVYLQEGPSKSSSFSQFFGAFLRVCSASQNSYCKLQNLVDNLQKWVSSGCSHLLVSSSADAEQCWPPTWVHHVSSSVTNKSWAKQIQQQLGPVLEPGELHSRSVTNMKHYNNLLQIWGAECFTYLWTQGRGLTVCSLQREPHFSLLNVFFLEYKVF